MAVPRSDLDAILASIGGIAPNARPNAILETFQVRERLAMQVANGYTSV
jgi:Ca2+-binding EF-hand superfamily protein